MSKNYHVVPHGDQWAVKEEGNPNPISIHDTQRDGIDLGRGWPNCRGANFSSIAPMGRFGTEKPTDPIRSHPETPSSN